MALGSVLHAHISIFPSFTKSGAHSTVLWGPQYKQWECELVMVTQLMSQGCVLHQAHDFQHLHTP